MLKQATRPIDCTTLCKELDINYGQVFKRLKVLSKNKILSTINSKPVFYKFDFKGQGLSFMEVECPQCKARKLVDINQTTVQCTCKTRTGNPFRYYLFNSRIKDIIQLK